MSVTATARRLALPLVLCLSLIALAGLVAAYYWSPVTDTLIVVEFLFVLVVAPRVSKRLIAKELPDLTAAHVAPALQAVVAKEIASIMAAEDQNFRVLTERLKLPVVPTVEQVAAAVLAALPAIPSKEEVAGTVLDALQAAQKGAASKAGEMQQAFIDALAARLRTEMEDVVANVDFGAPDPQEAAQVLAGKGVQARYARAAREEQFRAGVQEAGPLALTALDEWANEYPNSYRDYASRGLQGAQMLAQDPTVVRVAQKFGLKLPGGAAPAQGQQGQSFMPPGARVI